MIDISFDDVKKMAAQMIVDGDSISDILSKAWSEVENLRSVWDGETYNKLKANYEQNKSKIDMIKRDVGTYADSITADINAVQTSEQNNRPPML